MIRASVTICEVIWSLIDQPTTRREIAVYLHDGWDVVSACRKAGISDHTYCYWRTTFGGLGRPQLSEMEAKLAKGLRFEEGEPAIEEDRLGS